MRRLLAFALVLVMVPLGGCLKSKDHVTLNKDGSGTIVSTYEVDLTKARELLAAVAMLMGQGDPETIAKMKDEHLMNFEHPNWFRQTAAQVEGYEVRSATQRIVPVEAPAKEGEAKEGEAKADAARKRVTQIESTFASLAAAAQAQAFPIMSVELSRVEKSEKLPNGAWKLVVKDAVSGIDPAQTQGMDPSQMLPMFEPQLKNLTSSFRFTIPGKIIETNGTKDEDGCTASMSVDYNKMMEGKAVGLTIVFEAAEGAALTPFKHTPDLMALMPRLQQKPPVLEEPEKPVTTGDAPKDDAGKKDDAPKKDG